MTKQTLLVYLLCVSALCATLFASKVWASESKKMNGCRSQPVSVANESTRWVRVVGLRWLNDQETRWILKPINSQIIRRREQWSTLITPWGVKDFETYYQAKYQTLDDENNMAWSEVKTTSQVRVADCRSPKPITLKIVDLR